ncbi:IS1 family transposase [Xenorhabdus thuongxuanensis]|uniref:IS1 family transposase n=1 Tax=Xenorhabdus thuongxuanensis TaxID=1873484 RepID=UPI0009F9C2CF
MLSNLRQLLARFTCKTLSFSKYVEMYDRIIGYYLKYLSRSINWDHNLIFQ